jgi:hypothetical protein
MQKKFLLYLSSILNFTRAEFKLASFIFSGTIEMVPKLSFVPLIAKMMSPEETCVLFKRVLCISLWIYFISFSETVLSLRLLILIKGIPFSISSV